MAPFDENGIPVMDGPHPPEFGRCRRPDGGVPKAAGLTPITVINDEADMRVLFDVPFRPRMTEQFAAWLTAQMIAYDSLTSEYSPSGIQCMAGSDNAELQLVGWTQTTDFQKNPTRGEPPT